MIVGMRLQLGFTAAMFHVFFQLMFDVWVALFQRINYVIVISVIAMQNVIGLKCLICADFRVNMRGMRIAVIIFGLNRCS
jgi:uncharacterized protein (DUF983 family)